MKYVSESIEKVGDALRLTVYHALGFFFGYPEGSMENPRTDVHRTHWEQMCVRSGEIRREMIEQGADPSWADYEARRRCGLTR